MPLSERVDCAIVGGSFAGLSLACRLAQDGLTVRVIERRVGRPPAKARLTVQPNGLAALARIGLLAPICDLGTRIAELRFIERRSGRDLASYRYGELPGPHAFAVSMSPPVLQQCLLERLAELGAEPVVRGAEFVDVLRDRAVHGLTYRDSSGTSVDVEARCVVGADGARSSVRAALAIPVRIGRGVDSYVLGMGAIPSEMRVGNLYVYCDRGWHDGLVATTDGVHFWDHVAADNEDAVAANDLRRWRATYTARVPRGEEVLAPIHSWDDVLVARVRRVRAGSRAVDGAALIGDAAGTVHPAVAQGANLAMEDGVLLGEVLLTHPGRGPIPAALLDEYALPRSRKHLAYQSWSYFSAGCLDSPNRFWHFLGVAGLSLSAVRPVRWRQLRVSSGLAFGDAPWAESA
jgi:2-polyprenyl-6-methoxyphenol hydroxylase-like FAD-dependent oxidoreductase